MVQQATSDASSWLDVHADDVQPDAQPGDAGSAPEADARAERARLRALLPDGVEVEGAYVTAVRTWGVFARHRVSKVAPRGCGPTRPAVATHHTVSAHHHRHPFPHPHPATASGARPCGCALRPGHAEGLLHQLLPCAAALRRRPLHRDVGAGALPRAPFRPWDCGRWARSRCWRNTSASTRFGAAPAARSSATSYTPATTAAGALQAGSVAAQTAIPAGSCCRVAAAPRPAWWGGCKLLYKGLCV